MTLVATPTPETVPATLPSLALQSTLVPFVFAITPLDNVVLPNSPQLVKVLVKTSTALLFKIVTSTIALLTTQLELGLALTEPLQTQPTLNFALTDHLEITVQLDNVFLDLPLALPLTSPSPTVTTLLLTSFLLALAGPSTLTTRTVVQLLETVTQTSIL